MFGTIKNIHKEFLGLESTDKKNIFLVATNLFLLLFSYPLLRSASTAIFVESFGAKNTPMVWIYSVVALSVSVTYFNFIQKKKDVFYIYKLVSVFSAFVFIICNILYFYKINSSAYFYYVWKEVYIVLLVHLSMAYLNTKVNYRVAKLAYGPLGALGSFGGVLGGLLVNQLVPFVNIEIPGFGLLTIGLIGTLIVGLTATFFNAKSSEVYVPQNDMKKKSPLRSISTVKGYVFLIAAIVAISQFVINLSNYKFNIALESFVFGAEEKGAFLGKVYSSINFLSFVFQILIIPILFRFVKIKWVHFFIPFLFLGVFFVTLGPMGGFLPVTILFVTYKGLDYSLFSTGKEMLYFPLVSIQKYGAKYIVDMIVYRSSKMIISAILLFYNDLLFINVALILSLLIWLILTAFLFRKNALINIGENHV